MRLWRNSRLYNIVIHLIGRFVVVAINSPNNNSATASWSVWDGQVFESIEHWNVSSLAISRPLLARIPKWAQQHCPGTLYRCCCWLSVRAKYAIRFLLVLQKKYPYFSRSELRYEISIDWTHVTFTFCLYSPTTTPVFSETRRRRKGRWTLNRRQWIYGRKLKR